MQGLAIWITGLPGSGKSALSDGLRLARPELVLLRMDELRRVATPEPTYSDEERDILYRSLVYAAKSHTALGRDVLIDATGNLRRWRELARGLIPRFAEVYLKCPMDICVERERRRGRDQARSAPGGIYEKGARGWPVPGVNVPYEEPGQAELTIDTSVDGVPEAVMKVLGLIDRMGAGHGG